MHAEPRESVARPHKKENKYVYALPCEGIGQDIKGIVAAATEPIEIDRMSIGRVFSRLSMPLGNRPAALRHRATAVWSRGLAGPITTAQEDELDKWAQKVMIPVSLKDLLETGVVYTRRSQ